MVKKTCCIFAAALCLCILSLNLNLVHGLKSNNKNMTAVSSRRVLHDSSWYVDRCSCGKCKKHMRLPTWSNFCDREDWCYFDDQGSARDCPGAQKGKRSGKWLKCCSDHNEPYPPHPDPHPDPYPQDPQCRHDQKICYTNDGRGGTVPNCCCKVQGALEHQGRCICELLPNKEYIGIIDGKCEYKNKCRADEELIGGDCVKKQTCYNYCEVDLGDVTDYVSREIGRESDAGCRDFLITGMRNRIQNTLNIREVLSSSQSSKMLTASGSATFEGDISVTGSYGETSSNQKWTKFSDEPWVITVDGRCKIDESTYLCQQCQERDCVTSLFGTCVGDQGCRVKGINKAYLTCPLKARSMRRCCTSTGSNKL